MAISESWPGQARLSPSTGRRHWDPGHGCAHVNNASVHPLSTILSSASSLQVSLSSVPSSLFSFGSLSGSAHCCRQSPHDVTTLNGNKPLTHEPSEDVSYPELQKHGDGIASSWCCSKRERLHFCQEGDLSFKPRRLFV